MLDKSTVHKIAEAISKVVGEGEVVPMRYSGEQVLVKFETLGGYENLGKKFIDQKLQNFLGFKLMEIQGMILSP